MRQLRSMWRHRYGVVACLGVVLGLVGVVYAAATHPSNDNCRAQTYERWSYTGYTFTFQFETSIYCVDDGCSGNCNGPFQYGAVEEYIDGSGEPQTKTRYYCNCEGAPDHGVGQGLDGKHCEAIWMVDSGKDSGDPDRVTLDECLIAMCNTCDKDHEWEPHGETEEDPPPPPQEGKKYEFCDCS